MTAGARTDPRILDDIAIFHREGLTPTQIQKKLDLKIDRASGRGSAGLSTIKRLVKAPAPDVETDFVVPTTSANGRPELPTWTLIDDDTGAPAIVLETLAEVISHTSGGVTSFEVAEARMVAQIGMAFPTLRVLDRWSLAILYIVRRERGKRTDDIDTYLAFRPWEDDEDGVGRQYNYERAQRFGWVPEQPRPLSSDLRRVNLKHVDITADWIEAKQQLARAAADPSTHWVLGEPAPDDKQNELFDRLPGASSNMGGSGSWQQAIDNTLPKRVWPGVPSACDPSELGEALITDSVSNAVSNDERSVTSRDRPKRPRASGVQEVANGDE